MGTPPNIEALISERVEVALTKRFRCELSLPNAPQPLGQEDRRRALSVLFAEIAKGMGIERFLETPVERLDQFAVMSVARNHDTAGMLRSLVNSFMIAYACPETADRAFKALVELEALRAEVASARGLGPLDQSVKATGELKCWLAKRFPLHSEANPLYRIMFGPDRLFVMASEPIDGLPANIGEFPVELRLGSPVAKAH